MKSNQPALGRGVERIRLKILLHPIWMLLWPIVRVMKLVNRHFFSYVIGHVMRDKQRVYRVKFIWYGDAVYLHSMIWGSVILYSLAHAGVLSSSWLLLFWFIALVVCFVTVIYNFDVIKTSILAIVVVALLGAAYFSTVELAWNPFWAVSAHVDWLDARVSPGFFLAAAYVFFALIVSEIIWAWLFHRVEIDESYVYEHQCLQGTTREPIFARGLKRETKDLLELLILGAADIQHRTRNGVKRFKNVPFASLWLGGAIDSLLDYRSKGQPRNEQKDDVAEQARIQDAFHEGEDEDDDGDSDAA